MPDLAVRGGRVVTGEGIVDADILVLSGHISGIVARDEGNARQEIDARGLTVLPGVVDAHVHVNEPGRPEWEGWLAATRGAAAGGTTTIADMPLNSIPPTIDGDAFDEKYEAASASAVVDFALWGGLIEFDVERLRELAACGVVGVKAFMCPSGVPEFPHLREGTLVPALAAAKAAGLLVAVHCEDEAVIEVTTEHVRRSGRRDANAWLDSRPVEAERVAIEMLGEAARATRASVHVVHVSSHDAMRAVQRAKFGTDLTAETCPHYLTFTAADVEKIGSALKCAPPVRPSDLDLLWRDLTAPPHPPLPRVDYIASDHSPCPAALKRPGSEDMFGAWGGVSGIQSLLPVMLTEGVRRRRLSLVELAQLVATRPAKRLGIWPRKGEIRVGGDADLVLVDLDREWTLTTEALQTKSRISPYVGRAFHGAIARTLVRGRTVYADGSVVGAPGDGWFIQRVNV
ncbi:MAG TPA: allantoinase AllB [Candidatus Limnocylindrales bacterium]|nr:allantoinase AllB [Candidatus Limnocylindrales bacterium]